ncbi:hypothetical protein HIM_07515 [Hirsutella minnesotensis 3608]|uniref:Uncharacterized protein n=1 Tax=Hirsutella minnesotensis 3608 TaxID=1043627 RepID=A0A0F7ZHS8_9HYPO|nr:hypothetical protein HIM_07515 [Hirsutella minnesotensis 3608]
MLLVLLFAHILAASASWVLPHDLEDGDYTVTLPDASQRRFKPSQARLVRRGDDGRPYERPERPKRPYVPVISKTYMAPPPDPVERTPKEDWPDLIPVPVTDHRCFYSSFVMPQFQYEQARRAFARFCEDFLVSPRTIHINVSRNGTLAVYMCNFSHRNNVCSGREYEWVETNWLDMFCGTLIPGFVKVKPWGKSYGRAYPGDTLCPVYGPRIHTKLKEEIYFGTHPNADIKRPPVDDAFWVKGGGGPHAEPGIGRFGSGLLTDTKVIYGPLGKWGPRKESKEGEKFWKR